MCHCSGFPKAITLAGCERATDRSRYAVLLSGLIVYCRVRKYRVWRQPLSGHAQWPCESATFPRDI